MDDELKRMRREQRERWLASSNSSSSSSSSTSASSLSARGSGGRGSGRAPSNDGREDVESTLVLGGTRGNGSGEINAKRSRPLGVPENGGEGGEKANKVVDLTLDDDSDDSIVEMPSPPPRKKKSKRAKAANKAAEQESQRNSNKLGRGEGPISFSLASYNVWFADVHQTERMTQIAAILTSLQPHKPILVGLQEVTLDLSRMLFPHLRAAGYDCRLQDNIGSNGYGCAVAVLTAAAAGRSGSTTTRADVIASGFERYSDTIMERGLLWAHVRIASTTSSPTSANGGGSNTAATMEVLFGTTHLESFLGQHYNGVRQRAVQVRQARRFCENYVASAAGRSVDAMVVTGDLNWDDERKRSKGNDETLLTAMLGGDSSSNGISNYYWADAWLESRPGEDGYTYDAKLSPMLRGNLRRRFDRCLVGFPSTCASATRSNLRITECDVIGTDPIPGLSWRKEKQQWSRSGPTGRGTGEFITLPVLPSDHYGIHVKIDANR